MEFFILVVAVALWLIRKKLSSSEEKEKRQKRRFPGPTPWRDPWGEREDTLSFPDEEESGEKTARPHIPPVTEPVEREIQGQSEMTGDTAEGEIEKGEAVQETISTVEESAEAGPKTVQPPLRLLSRKRRRPLGKGLFTKDNLVRGIIMREMLGPAPSHRHFQRMRRRAR